MGKLNALSVKNAKPGRHGDGGGLYLLVKPTGARSWLLRVRVEGRRRDIGLGSIAKLSLAEAREEAAKLLKHALNGRDPVIERDRRAFVAKTFREAAVATHAAKADGWASKTADAFLTSMQDHAYPALGDLLVEHIEAADIARALKPIWTDKPAMAVKVRHRTSGRSLSSYVASCLRRGEISSPGSPMFFRFGEQRKRRRFKTPYYFGSRLSILRGSHRWHPPAFRSD